MGRTKVGDGAGHGLAQGENPKVTFGACWCPWEISRKLLEGRLRFTPLPWEDAGSVVFEVRECRRGPCGYGMKRPKSPRKSQLRLLKSHRGPGCALAGHGRARGGHGRVRGGMRTGPFGSRSVRRARVCGISGQSDARDRGQMPGTSGIALRVTCACPRVPRAQRCQDHTGGEQHLHRCSGNIQGQEEEQAAARVWEGPVY